MFILKLSILLNNNILIYNIPRLFSIYTTNSTKSQSNISENILSIIQETFTTINKKNIKNVLLNHINCAVDTIMPICSVVNQINRKDMFKISFNKKIIKSNNMKHLLNKDAISNYKLTIKTLSLKNNYCNFNKSSSKSLSENLKHIIHLLFVETYASYMEKLQTHPELLKILNFMVNKYKNPLCDTIDVPIESPKIVNQYKEILNTIKQEIINSSDLIDSIDIYMKIKIQNYNSNKENNKNSCSDSLSSLFIDLKNINNTNERFFTETKKIFQPIEQKELIVNIIDKNCDDRQNSQNTSIEIKYKDTNHSLLDKKRPVIHYENHITVQSIVSNFTSFIYGTYIDIIKDYIELNSRQENSEKQNNTTKVSNTIKNKEQQSHKIIKKKTNPHKNKKKSSKESSSQIKKSSKESSSQIKKSSKESSSQIKKSSKESSSPTKNSQTQEPNVSVISNSLKHQSQHKTKNTVEKQWTYGSLKTKIAAIFVSVWTLFCGYLGMKQKKVRHSRKDNTPNNNTN